MHRGFIFVAFYNSQGYGEAVLTHLRTGLDRLIVEAIFKMVSRNISELKMGKRGRDTSSVVIL
jgi:hypothetical protein